MRQASMRLRLRLVRMVDSHSLPLHTIYDTTFEVVEHILYISMPACCWVPRTFSSFLRVG